MQLEGKSLATIKLLLAILMVFLAFAVVGCGSNDSSATKDEQARFKDRNPQDIHAPPAGVGPGHAGGPPPGPPPGAAGPPSGTK